ncbi:MAG: polysaccharide biosynthesis tyrosine autokinase [Bacteroidales bacterium]|jgi:capsular exopolysaccharide synthesis family protein|nr:polysaccharide biosynthesis tyrosine autokinase [Bacteroidales bacterium]
MDPNYSSDNLITNEDYSIDIQRYISLFLSNWYWFAIALLISLSIVYGVNRYSEKLFTVSSTMLIKDDLVGGGLSSNETFISGSDYFKTRQNLRNEISILKSYTLNQRVIEDLPDFHIIYVGVGRRNIVEKRLYNECPFIVIPNSDKKQLFGVQISVIIISENKYRIVINGDTKTEKEMLIGEVFEERGFSFIVKPRSADKFDFDPDLSNKYYFRFASPQSLANQYRNRLIISPIEEEASIVRMTLTGPVAQQEADYLNKLMELYITQGLEFKNQTADSTIKFIDLQLNLISSSLSIAESNLENFRRANKLIDLSKEGAIIQNRFERFEIERTGLELQKKYYEYLTEYLSSKNETGDLVSPTIMGVSDPQLIRMVQELAQLQQQKKKLEMNLDYQTEPLSLMEEEIKRAKSALNENVESGMRNINSSLSDVITKIIAVESEVSKLPATESQMIGIQREFDINNSVYTYLLEKRAEAGIAKASNVSDNKIIDRAYIFNSSMVKPKKKQNLTFALLLGFFIPALGLFLIDFFNNRIIDKRDVAKGTNAPIIGFISHNDYKSEIPVNDKPGSTLAESFRSVRTNLKYFVKESKTPVIAVSSTITAEGKTFISVNLATITAKLGKKVLLIGLDLRKPRIHKVLEVENGRGMSTYLCGDINYEEAIQKTGIENLYYAPAGQIPPNPAELIETVRMQEFIEQAKKEFDYIIIDTPPIAIVTDALVITPYVDMYILVVRQRYTSKNTLSIIQDLYTNKTFKNLGIIINDISLTGYYGYGLRYGYSLGYGYSYGYNYYGKYVYSKYGYSETGKRYYSEES